MPIRARLFKFIWWCAKVLIVSHISFEEFNFVFNEYLFALKFIHLHLNIWLKLFESARQGSNWLIEAHYKGHELFDVARLTSGLLGLCHLIGLWHLVIRIQILLFGCLILMMPHDLWMHRWITGLLERIFLRDIRLSGCFHHRGKTVNRRLTFLHGRILTQRRLTCVRHHAWGSLR